MRNLVIVGLLVALGLYATNTQALGPYENALAISKVTHVGLLAAAKDGKSAELDKALKCLTCKKCTTALKKQGISNVSAFSKTLTDKKTWYWVYFDYQGKNYLEAAKAFEKAVPNLTGLVTPHPRAKRYGTTWLQMEWICFIRGCPDAKLKTQKTVGVVTRIRPEKEQEYRTLHQTVWPGVIDQIARSNNRNLSIYLVELGDEIYEFLYLEYVGTDSAADDASSKSDPCTLRWWKLTDACQLPLPDVKEGIWAGMDTVVE